MHYVTVFDASDPATFFRDWWIVVFLLFPLVIVWREFFKKGKSRPKLSDEASSFHRFLVWIAAPGLTIGFLAIGSGIVGAAFLSRQALVSGDCQTVEGRVSHFRPQPHPKADEHFEVAGHGFDYSQRQLWGFHQVTARGGPIREGLAVRICDHAGVILKLEVARS